MDEDKNIYKHWIHRNKIFCDELILYTKYVQLKKLAIYEHIIGKYMVFDSLDVYWEYFNETLNEYKCFSEVMFKDVFQSPVIELSLSSEGKYPVGAEYETYLVENWTTDTLILHLNKQNLKLDEDDFAILRKKKFNGLTFLEITEEKFMQDGLERGPAILLAKEIDPHPIEENSPEFKLCIDDILHRIKNMDPVVDSNEAMRCEYISTILHTAVSLLEGLVISPQMNVSGSDSFGRVDYAIKKTWVC
ncbi:hypothetical protein C1645_819486 [Glomus cerebriforme]|uniref:Uncharacterized protein n=1 Tax=Glomus cerebriforme TaxID=658196 RepID=A0A397TAF7_9GLOM|nr:hypothetical protein C1645_819486 [Glomus cerebriforme]